MALGDGCELEAMLTAVSLGLPPRVVMFILHHPVIDDTVTHMRHLELLGDNFVLDLAAKVADSAIRLHLLELNPSVIFLD